MFSDQHYHSIILTNCTNIFQDPMMHRIIEKRRRDRMNNCLAELSHLIPNDYVKQVDS